MGCRAYWGRRVSLGRWAYSGRRACLGHWAHLDRQARPRDNNIFFKLKMKAHGLALTHRAFVGFLDL